MDGDEPTAMGRVDRTRLSGWLEVHAGTGPVVSAEPLAGGNSNATYRLQTATGSYVLRRPPHAAISASAHSMEREHRVLQALRDTPVRVPRPVAMCIDPGVIGAPFLVMEAVDGVPLTDRLPSGYAAGSVAALGRELVDGLADLHAVDWEGAGLGGFGRPQGFLDRQVARWRSQYESYAVRDLPRFSQVATWLEEHRPAESPPAILHGDYHLDNCLWDVSQPRLLAIIDWELSTIGDPMLDVGLCLALWGNRPAGPALPRIQAVSRAPGSPDREELAHRYAERSGRAVTALPYYLALSLWKLAAILEGAYAQHEAGDLDTEYARGLRDDVPHLLEEAAAHAGLGAPRA